MLENVKNKKKTNKQTKNKQTNKQTKQNKTNKNKRKKKYFYWDTNLFHDAEDKADMIPYYVDKIRRP